MMMQTPCFYPENQTAACMCMLSTHRPHHWHFKMNSTNSVAAWGGAYSSTPSPDPAKSCQASRASVRTASGTAAAELLWKKIHPTSLQGDDEVLADVALPPRRRIRVKARDDKYVHHCTEWDKFHREDIALSRAIKKSPLAEEVYEVSAAISHMFHHGDGRLILESAGHAVGHHRRSSGMPGATRKAVGLGGEPGNLLANFPAYAAGMHGRMEWRHQGHGQQYAARVLVDTGRRLTSVDFVAFTLLFRDIFRVCISPWSLVIQSSALAMGLARKKESPRRSAANDTGMH